MKHHGMRMLTCRLEGESPGGTGVLVPEVQGGIGWTDEQNLHRWFKRIGNSRHLLGGPEYLPNRAAELQGFAVVP